MSPSPDWKRHSADLLQLYMQRGLVGPYEYSPDGWTCKNFTTWRTDKSEASPGGKQLYTSAFTCPVRGIHFPSGMLEKVQGVHRDGAYWYKTSRRAIQAAAAKAIDCIGRLDSMSSPNHREAPPRCCDALLVLPSGPQLPPLSMDLARVLKKKRLASKKYQVAATAA